MLKQNRAAHHMRGYCQPPSGGCVLKLMVFKLLFQINNQPPSGGCVLKPAVYDGLSKGRYQPPSGGCVLKPIRAVLN